MTTNELQELLRSIRKELGLSQQDVINRLRELDPSQIGIDDKLKLSITRQHYGYIENGERRPSPEVAKGIAAVLGIHWAIFFDVQSNEKLREHQTA